jgi:hypothetical protein
VAAAPGTAHARLLPTLEGDWYTDEGRFVVEQSSISWRETWRWDPVKRAGEARVRVSDADVFDPSLDL